MKISALHAHETGPIGLPFHFDLIDIRLLINIAEKKNLSQGAEQSYMSPPAASIRIRNIEEKLGTRLLNRSSQGVSPTPAGDAFIRHGRLVLQQLEYLRSDLQEVHSTPQQQLRICAGATAITEFLPGVLSTYFAEGPNVNVELIEQSGAQIVRTIREGGADLGIVEGNQTVEGLELLPYRKDRLVLITSAENPLGGKPRLAFRETLNYDYVAVSNGVPAPGPGSGANLNIRARVANFEVMCRLVSSGIGIAILPESAARRNAAHNVLRIVSLTDEWAEGVLRVCMRSFDALPSFARKLVELLSADGLVAT
jgi:DNA-binding transcriptional LysR family regulator